MQLTPDRISDVDVLAMALLILVATLGASQLSAQTQDQTIRGTVNVVLANSRGMVVLTDSTGTLADTAGNRVGSQEAQKLIRIDDHSVCAIAGFGSAKLSAGIQFNVDVVGIVSDFRDQLAAKKGNLSFDQKLKALSFVLQSYIRSYANIREMLLPGGLTSQSLYFSLFLVGTDSDGHAKVGTLAIGAIPTIVPGDKIRWEFNEGIAIKSVGSGFLSAVGGMRDVGLGILRNPQLHSESPIVRKYMASVVDSTALDVTALEELAKFIAAQTSKQYPLVVGGPNQLAVLQNGRITKFEQHQFPTPPKPMPIALIMDVPLQFGPGGGFEFPKGTSIIWIRNKIVGYQGLTLDGNFFLGNEIRDAVVYYDDGPTVFDSSNKVFNSRLYASPPIGPNAAFLRYLRENFQWSECIPFSCDAH